MTSQSSTDKDAYPSNFPQSDAVSAFLRRPPLPQQEPQEKASNDNTTMSLARMAAVADPVDSVSPLPLPNHPQPAFGSDRPRLPPLSLFQPGQRLESNAQLEISPARSSQYSPIHMPQPSPYSSTIPPPSTSSVPQYSDWQNQPRLTRGQSQHFDQYYSVKRRRTSQEDKEGVAERCVHVKLYNFGLVTPSQFSAYQSTYSNMKRFGA